MPKMFNQTRIAVLSCNTFLELAFHLHSNSAASNNFDFSTIIFLSYVHFLSNNQVQLCKLIRLFIFLFSSSFDRSCRFQLSLLRIIYTFLLFSYFYLFRLTFYGTSNIGSSSSTTATRKIIVSF